MAIPTGKKEVSGTPKLMRSREPNSIRSRKKEREGGKPFSLKKEKKARTRAAGGS